MDAIGFVDFLEADPRPTFVVDLLPELPEWKLDVIFRNQPLRNRNSVFHDFLSRTQESPELREWIKSEDEGSSRTDNGVRWTVFTVGQRWRVVSCEYWRETPMPTGAGQNIMRSETSTPAKAHGTPVDEDADLSWDISRQPDESVSDSLTHALRDGRRPSIAELVACTPLHTRLASLIPRGVSAEADAHWELVQSIHWDKTVLGAMDIWPSEMLQLVRIVMMDPEPRALLLGDESRLLYNRAYGEMSTDRHPRILGMPFADAWEEARQDVSTILATVRASGTTFIRESYSVFLEDGKGSLVERIFRWLVIPLQYP
ncbi:hypothetical protein H2203_003121 [Taxawa tesnikishii (nom. ined.)]|nr:hypothetical protein H2203_003121 [Dothideales sp. JES 119]